jgi:hypothetical protein
MEEIGLPGGNVYLWCSSEQTLDVLMSADDQGGVPRFTVLGDVFIKNHYIALAYSDDKPGKPKVGIGRRPDVGVVL